MTVTEHGHVPDFVVIPDTDPVKYRIVRCLDPRCGFWAFRASRTLEDYQEAFAEHVKSIEQSGPSPTPDIEVQWMPVACCSACADEVGDVVVDPQTGGESLICTACQSTWTLSGTNGRTPESD